MSKNFVKRRNEIDKFLRSRHFKVSIEDDITSYKKGNKCIFVGYIKIWMQKDEITEWEIQLDWDDYLDAIKDFIRN